MALAPLHLALQLGQLITGLLQTGHKFIVEVAGIGQNARLQLFGAGEMAYLSDQTAPLREKLLNDVFFKKIPAVVVSRGLPVDDLLLRIADRHHVPLIRTQLKSKDFSAEVLNLKEKGVTAVYLGTLTTESAAVMSEFRRLGMTPRWPTALRRWASGARASSPASA